MKEWQPKIKEAKSREGAKLAARIVRGADPAAIPFTNMKQARLVVNLRQAKELGVRVPQAIVLKADEVIQ